MPKLEEIHDPVLVSIIAVADRKTAELLKDKFGDKPIIMGGAVHLTEDEIEFDGCEEFQGAFNATFVAGEKGEEEEEDDGEPLESIILDDLEDDG